jgi:endonuclease III
MLVLLVDVGAEVVAVIAILGNVSVVDVHVGRIVRRYAPAALRGRRSSTTSMESSHSWPASCVSCWPVDRVPNRACCRRAGGRAFRRER